jgi:hypothetical protein
MSECRAKPYVNRKFESRSDLLYEKREACRACLQWNDLHGRHGI